MAAHPSAKLCSESIALLLPDDEDDDDDEAEDDALEPNSSHACQSSSAAGAPSSALTFGNAFVAFVAPGNMLAGASVKLNPPAALAVAAVDCMLGWLGVLGVKVKLVPSSSALRRTQWRKRAN